MEKVKNVDALLESQKADKRSANSLGVKVDKDDNHFTGFTCERPKKNNTARRLRPNTQW